MGLRPLRSLRHFFSFLSSSIAKAICSYITGSTVFPATAANLPRHSGKPSIVEHPHRAWMHYQYSAVGR